MRCADLAALAACGIAACATRSEPTVLVREETTPFPREGVHLLAPSFLAAGGVETTTTLGLLRDGRLTVGEFDTRFRLEDRPRVMVRAHYVVVAADGAREATFVTGATGGGVVGSAVALEGTPLATDGRWLLGVQEGSGGSTLRVVELGVPERRAEYATVRHPTRAVAVEGGFLVFASDPGGGPPGWIAVRPEATAVPEFEEVSEPGLGVVFDAFAEPGAVVVGAWTWTDGAGAQRGVQVLRLAVEGGAPGWPARARLELPEIDAREGAAFLAWSDGLGVVEQLETVYAFEAQGCPWWETSFHAPQPSPCSARSSGRAYLVREQHGTLAATPILLPYVELAFPIFDRGDRAGSRLAVSAGRIGLVEGPPYAVSWYGVREPAP